MKNKKAITAYPIHTTKGRVLLKNHNIMVKYRRGKVLYSDLVNDSGFCISLPYKFTKRILSKFRMTERLLRLEPRCAIMTGKDILISCCHGVYRLDIATQSLIKELEYRQEMNNPLVISSITGVPGFEDGVVFGEYVGSYYEDGVAIWQRDQCRVWKKKFVFPVNEILHIHNIVPDPVGARVLILTGDSDSESAIWEAKNDFNEIKKLVGGSQDYRSCVAFPTNEGIIFATDTPLKTNHLYFLKSGEIEPRKIMQLPGTCIFGTTFIDRQGRIRFAFSTAVEPDSTLPKQRYHFTYKLGKGIKSRSSFLYLLKDDGNLEILLQGKKDIWPMWLFQFGNFKFSSMDSGLGVTGQSLLKYDERTIEFDI